MYQLFVNRNKISFAKKIVIVIINSICPFRNNDLSFDAVLAEDIYLISTDIYIHIAVSMY
jgi:hypothetical protein